MDDSNHVKERIDTVIARPDTPEWGKVMLLCVRDDHERLVAHLAAHRSWSDPVRQVLVSVATALAVAWAIWLVAGRLPAVFGL